MFGQIFGVNGVPLFNALVRGEPLHSQLRNFDLKKLKTSFYDVVQSIFRYLEPFGVTYECGRHTDGRTDRRRYRRTDGPTLS